MERENRDFVYVTYIKTSPEKLWEALTSPEFTRQYWFGIDVTSDWKVGSPLTYVRAGGKVVMDGKVLIADRPKVMAYTFHETNGNASHEPPTKVTLELSVHGPGVVRLTVTHTDFVVDSKHLPSISHGWPAVLSNLKSLLETGESIQTTV